MSSSGLSVGIVGLPNVGKSTLFNALLRKQQAYVANYPFATIEPNVGVVPVPDVRLHRLAEVVAAAEAGPAVTGGLPPEVPATVRFVDIAGLVAGAHKGEGLGNKFLSYIREVDLIAYVLRDFADPDIVRSGSVDIKSDLSTLVTELILADLQTLDKQSEPRGVKDPQALKRWSAVSKLRDGLNRGLCAREVELGEDEREVSAELQLLTAKPYMVVVNVSEGDYGSGREVNYAGVLGADPGQVVVISAKIEAELAGLSEGESAEYLKSLGLDKSGLERLIVLGFDLLGLMTFLTAGVKEVRAWTVKKGTKAPQAAGVIHTDFESNFIRADVVDFADFVSAGGWQKVREAGKVRSEGRDYVMREGDVVEFKVGV